MATKKLSNTTGSKLHQPMKSGPWMGGKFPSGWRHPKAIDLREREKELLHWRLGTLTLLSGTLRRAERSRQVIKASCSACGLTRELLVDNVISKKTTGCRCQRGKKYFDPRSDTLGARYDAMVQRCTRDTHVSSRHYKGRGVRVLFKSREDFIRWALKKYPNTDFKGLVFDRRDNEGHYSKSNLRLTTQSINIRNGRRWSGSTT
jgi:hypothetical protein